MRNLCYTLQNISKLWLSPYVKVSEKDGALVFTQLMFQTVIVLHGAHEHLVECKRLLESGVDSAELCRWGEGRFPEFSTWVNCAMRAGVIE